MDSVAQDKQAQGGDCTGSMTTHTIWWSTKARGSIVIAIRMSAFRNTCCSESKARPASSLCMRSGRSCIMTRSLRCLRVTHRAVRTWLESDRAHNSVARAAGDTGLQTATSGPDAVCARTRARLHLRCTSRKRARCSVSETAAVSSQGLAS